MKIVFSVSGSQPSTFDPIVAEEIMVTNNLIIIAMLSGANQTNPTYTYFGVSLSKPRIQE